MKMSPVVVLATLFAGVDAIKFRSFNASGNNTTNSTPDHFRDEIVDQANMDFAMSDVNGDGCVDESEAKKEIDQQFGEHTPVQTNSVTDQIDDLRKNMEKMKTAVGENFEKADVNADGCLDDEEFEEWKLMGLQKCESSFTAMDSNLNGMVSKQEAYNYASEHMHHADISEETLKEIFANADKNKDDFLDQKEFCEAGPAFDGDGKGK